MTTTDIVTTDQAPQRWLSRSSRTFVFALWAVAMRCFHQPRR
jgi:hypothetical protein